MKKVGYAIRVLWGIGDTRHIFPYVCARTLAELLCPFLLNVGASGSMAVGFSLFFREWSCALMPISSDEGLTNCTYYKSVESQHTKSNSIQTNLKWKRA